MLKPILVGGEWRRGRGEVYASRYPADDTVNAELAAANVADVEEAIEAADAARRRPDWANLKPHERASVLYRISALIRERAEELAQLQRRDNGKPINETRALVASAAGTFQFFAAACETLEETITPPRGDYLTMSVHEPMGVIAAITPWNSPIASEAQKLAPALAAGNAVDREAGGGDAARRARARPHLRAGGGAEGRGERRARQGLGHRRCDRQAPAGEEGVVHRRHDHRPRARAARRRQANAGDARARRQVADDRVRGRRSRPRGERRAVRDLQLVRANRASPARACSSTSRSARSSSTGWRRRRRRCASATRRTCVPRWGR